MSRMGLFMNVVRLLGKRLQKSPLQFEVPTALLFFSTVVFEGLRTPAAPTFTQASRLPYASLLFQTKRMPNSWSTKKPEIWGLQGCISRNII